MKNNKLTKIQKPRKKTVIKKEKTPWIIPEDIELQGKAGFIYLIKWLDTGNLYLGRKYLLSTSKVKIPGKKRRQVKTKESDWHYYRSSSKLVQQLIKEYGLHRFEFRILASYDTRAQVNFAETSELFKRDVLTAKLSSGEYLYLNDCILQRYYKGRYE